ncbi:MAG: pyruvate, phosphate dikinase [Rubrimonas sp.]
MTLAADIVDLGQAHDAARYGAKAARVAALMRAGVPTPPGFAVSVADGARLAAVGASALEGALDGAIARLEQARGRRLGDPERPLLLSVRTSAGEGASGATAILNIGACAAAEPGLAARVGLRAARDLRRRLILSFAPPALGVDPEMLEQATLRRGPLNELDAEGLAALIEDLRAVVAEETGDPFPEDPREQLSRAMAAAARAWSSPRARLLRAARGEGEDVGLGFIVQAMALGVGFGASGAGQADSRCARTGTPTLAGRWLPQGQGEDAALGLDRAAPIMGDCEGSLERAASGAVAALAAAASQAETALGDAARIEFTVEDGALEVLDATPMPRSARAAVRIAVDMANEGRISRAEALLRIDPGLLIEHLHPTVDPAAKRDVIGRGLRASPGAASGPIAFSADAAEVFSARGQPAILVKVETGPEDIRGMHVAAGVITARGGLTSHAAVVARGLGAPCVVGMGELRLDAEAGILFAGGREFREGDVITVDGGAGEALAGAAPMLRPEFSGAFATLMVWADAHRRMGVRANADTPADARVARGFNVDGVGLCRTEHMFFEPGRITAMREMILADAPEARRAALERLLPWQRADFVELFTIMKGLPVTIRLLDPPLHEFLPRSPRDMRELAEAMGLPVARVEARAAELAEINPMLGLRGCRLGVTVPEIYQMQARAIFEAAVEAAEVAGAAVEPEIMIPLVSTNRESEILKALVDEVAAAVRAERGRDFSYKVGVMVETPRAALRAEEIARGAGFMSFGTNDLTQMTYGLSRDDAGSFMRDYLARGVFADDPFHSLDVEGVGELLLIAAERARRGRKDISLGLCGEHGGDPASVRFCELAGFDYVSCSPYRAPIARLAAAQASILSRRARGANLPGAA